MLAYSLSGRQGSLSSSVRRRKIRLMIFSCLAKVQNPGSTGTIDPEYFQVALSRQNRIPLFRKVESSSFRPDSAASIRESRMVNQDYTIRWHGVLYEVEKKQIKASHAWCPCAGRATFGWKHVDALVEPSAGLEPLPDPTTQASHACCPEAPSDDVEVGRRKSTRQTMRWGCARARDGVESAHSPQAKGTSVALVQTAGDLSPVGWNAAVLTGS